MSDSAFPQCWCEPSSPHLALHLGHLSVQVTPYDDLGSCILPNDALHKADDGLRPFNHVSFVPWLQVDVKEVDLLSIQRDLGPVQVGAQRLHPAVALEVAEGDAAA